MRTNTILIDTSVLCPAINLNEYKGKGLIQILNRIWKECYVWVVDINLREEYARSLTQEGIQGSFFIHRFIEKLEESDKVIIEDVPQNQVDDYIKKHDVLKKIRTDVPHLIAASRNNALYAIFIDKPVESRRNQIKTIFGLDVLDPLEYSEKEEKEHCTDTIFPYPNPF